MSPASSDIIFAQGISDMNPGVTDEAGKTARTLVEALKSTPGILALVLFNLAFIGSIVWIQHQNGQRWERLMTETLKNCAVHKLQSDESRPFELLPPSKP